MARQFLTLTQDEIDERIAEGIRARELELLGYDIEQAGHEATLTTLADVGEWDAETKEFQGLARDNMIVVARAKGLPEETLTKAATLNHRERTTLNLQAVKIELAQSELHLANLLAQLPEGARRTRAMQAVAAKASAAQAAKE